MSVLRVSRRFPGCSLRNFACPLMRRGFTTTEGNNTDADQDFPKSSAGPAQPTFVTWERFSSVDKDTAIMKIHIGELRSELTSLGNKMETKFEKLDSKLDKIDSKFDRKFEKLDSKFDKIDMKFERSDNKIDRLVYFFLGGLVLKGGFDFYMNKEAQKDHTAGVDCVTKN